MKSLQNKYKIHERISTASLNNMTLYLWFLLKELLHKPRLYKIFKKKSRASFFKRYLCLGKKITNEKSTSSIVALTNNLY